MATSSSRGQPSLPRGLCRTDRESVPITDEWHLQDEWLAHQNLQPPLIAVAGGTQSELAVAPGGLVDESGHAEFLREARELAAGRGAFCEIDEVSLDATFGEESERLPGVRILLHSEDLSVHACRTGIIERTFVPSFAPVPRDVSRPSEYTYTPAWWVPGAHLRTLWGKLLRRPPLLETRVERWPTDDGDELELHRLEPRDGVASHGGRLLVLHGLEGTIRSHYLRGLLAHAQRVGWAADALLFRTCNGEMTRARRLYHSGETTDLQRVVQRLVREHPGQPLALAGFSLGGNVLLKWLGEHGDDLPREVHAAAVVSVPFDLERGSRFIEQGFGRVYTRHFLRTLRAKARRKLECDPGLFDAVALERATTLFEFDDAVTAPVHGFENASDYYRRSSSLKFLPLIRRPTLLLSAYDDPFLPSAVLREVERMAVGNPYLSVEFHQRGGHVGFISGRAPWEPRYYAEERVLGFLGASVHGTLP